MFSHLPQQVILPTSNYTLLYRAWRPIILNSKIPWMSRVSNEMKWAESGFRPPLCTYRLNLARRTSWGWWDDWDDTVLQTQDSKFEPWRSEAEHVTSRSRRLPTIMTYTRGWGRNIFCSFKTAGTGNRTPNSGVKGSNANHYPRAPAPRISRPANRTALDSCLRAKLACFRWYYRSDR